MSSRAAVAREGASGGNTCGPAWEPADPDAAGDDAARDAKAAQLLQFDVDPSAEAAPHRTAEQSTHVDMPEPGVAAALRDLTEQVQNLRTSTANMQQEARRADNMVSCCTREPANLASPSPEPHSPDMHPGPRLRTSIDGLRRCEARVLLWHNATPT